MKTFLLPILMTGLFCAAAQAQPSSPPAAILAKCATCHGAAGNSSSTMVPRLNGQWADYLNLRFKQFLDPTRNTPHATYLMWETATGVSDKDAMALARYFAAQKPTPPAPVGARASLGAKIYLQGVPADAIPSCQGCHGAKGEGAGTTPRLAGQHAGYLVQELQAMQLALRVSDPMNRHAWHLGEDQIEAVSAYLGNQ